MFRHIEESKEIWINLKSFKPMREDRLRPQVELWEEEGIKEDVI